MHGLVKHIKSNFGIVLLSLIFLSVTPQSNADQSVEEIIKGRKALFSKNYSTAKRVQALSSNDDFDQAKKLMIEMSENYKTLIGMFPENTKEGFKTESLPIIWEEKDAFNALMQKSSDNMVKLASVIEDSDDIRATLSEFMWSSCKACHSKYRKPH
jgi:cytochrome c556|tara:strand:- start:834 stop:1301 length:468 start_codon:yes stop_codon:yes gene_type:complete